MSPTEPAAAKQLLLDAIDAGWNASFVRSEDTGGAPFISVEGRHSDYRRFLVTWHTRDTGTYRLFSCVLGRRTLSLSALRAEVTS